MSDKRQIRESIRKLSGNKTYYAKLAKVVNVDLATNLIDCEDLDEGGNILGVKLIAQNQTGFLIIPKLNSTVLVSFINEPTGFVSMFSEVDEIQLNGDAFGGLTKIADLVTKLNNLESAFNTHILAYNLHVHAGVTVGAGATAITTPDTQTLTPTVQAELENTVVKHGDGT